LWRRRGGKSCLQYDLHRSTDLTGQFFLHEVWRRASTTRAYEGTPILRWNARKDALLAAREATYTWQQIA